MTSQPTPNIRNFPVLASLLGLPSQKTHLYEFLGQLNLLYSLNTNFNGHFVILEEFLGYFGVFQVFMTSQPTPNITNFPVLA